MDSDNDRLIDLDAAIAEKFHGKKLPRPVMWFLKKLIHQDFINSIIVRHGDGLDFCEGVVKELGLKVEVEGLENIPADGTLYTFASNHPLGGADGMILASIVGRRYGVPYLMVNDFLMFLKPLVPLSIPVNKTGAQGRNLPAQVNQIFHSDRQIMLFPAGLCSRRNKGVISDLEWKKTFITKSVETGRTVVPVHFIGRNSNRFYFVANLCKWLKLKFNIAMVLLPDECYRTKGKTFRVVFGKPIPAETFDSSRTPSQWAAWVKEQVYNLN